jgi:hypothetical protein
MESLKSKPIKLTGSYATDSDAALKEILSLLKQAGLSANVETMGDRSDDQWKTYKYQTIDDAAHSCSVWRQRQVKDVFKNQFLPRATVVHVSDSGETLGAIVIGIRMYKPFREWSAESIFGNKEATVDISFITSVLSKTIKDDTTGFDGFLKKTNFRQLNKPNSGGRYYRATNSGDNSSGTNPSKYFARTCLKHTEAPNGYFTSEAVINKKVNTLSLARVANMACLFKTISNRKTKIDKLGSKNTVNIAKMNVEVSIAEALTEMYGEGNFETQEKAFEIDPKIMNAIKPFHYNVRVMPKSSSDIKHGMSVELEGHINLETKQIEISPASSQKVETSEVTNEYGFEIKELKQLLFSSNSNIVRMATDLINKNVGVKDMRAKDSNGIIQDVKMLIENPTIEIKFTDVDRSNRYRSSNFKSVVRGTNILGDEKYAVEPNRHYFFNAFDETQKVKYGTAFTYGEFGNIFKDILETQNSMFTDFKKL